MTGSPILPLSRRSLLTGTAALFAAPAGVRAQALAPPHATGGAGGGQSAVIDVSRARTDPIPIAVPALGGADGNSSQLGQDIATVITNDLARSGLFRPIAPGAFIQAGAAQGDSPNFQNWRAVGAQALVTGRAEVQGGGQIRVEFRLWDVLPQTQIQGTAYSTSQSNWRRIAHIMADVIYERLLGEKGYFDTRIVYIGATGPRDRRTKRLAIMDQDSENNRFLTDGAWLVLTPRFHPTRDEIAFMSYANNRPRVYLFSLGSGQQEAWRFRGHDLCAALLAGRQPRDHVGDARRRVGSGHCRPCQPRVAPADHSGSIDVSPATAPTATRSRSIPTVAAISNST